MAWSVQAQETNKSNQGWFDQTSSVTSNLVAWVGIPNPIPTVSDEIVYGFNSAGTNEIYLFLAPLHPRAYHLCRVEMTDTNGQPHAKTPIAIELNANFWTQTNVFNAGELKKLKPEWKHLTPNIASPRSFGGIAHHFYKPEQLFKIEKPGKYILKLEFQVIKAVEYRPGAAAYVITFPPIEIQIVKNP